MSIGLYIVLAPLYLKSVRKLQEKRFVFVKILAIIIPENGAKVSKIKCFQFAQQTLSKTTRYIGYSIQQYSKRKFKNGERPTQAYEKVINSFHAEIEKALGKFVKDGIESEELKLGDVPYVYSIIPLSQTANTPIFELSYATGVRGNQTSSVENYKKYLNTLAENFIKNVGE